MVDDRALQEFIGVGVRRGMVRADGVTPNTIAPMLTGYVPNDVVWTCPKRKRGLDYVTPSGIQPGNLTSRVSFCTGSMKSASSAGRIRTPVEWTERLRNSRSSSVQRPADMVAICDVSGSNDPAQINGDADAAWLDTVWAGNSGPSPVIGFNGRVQTAYAKHRNRINVVYVDGHAASTYPSRLTWGQFWGVFTPGSC